MKFIDFKLLAVAVFVVFSTGHVALAGNASKPNPAVEVKLTAFKVIVDVLTKKEVLTAANKVAPGDLLEYKARYQNNGNALLKRVTATLPLPIGMTYIAGSAKPANALASTDGSSYETIPLKRMVKQPNGKLEEQLIPLSQYRSLRWNLNELAGKSKVEVSARVKVDNGFTNETTSK